MALLAQVSSDAERYFEVHGSYGVPASSCSTDGTVFLEERIKRNLRNAEKNSLAEAQCLSTGSEYAVAILLRSQTAVVCVDSTGSRIQIPQQIKITGPSCETDN